MSFSAPSSVANPQPFVVSSPDRVLVRTIPHPLASTNKRVTLSLRRSPTIAPALSAQQPQPVSIQLLAAQSSLESLQIANSASEPSTVPQNSQIPNGPHHHRRSMSNPTMKKSPPPRFTTTIASSAPAAPTALSLDQQPRYPRVSTTGASPPATPLTKALPAAATASLVVVTPTTTTHLHKNGLPIRSAMKSPSAVSDKTSPTRRSPTTLTSPRYVHFNTQLEHVRLFLQGETPSSVGTRETLIDPRQDEATCGITLTCPNWTPLLQASDFHLDSEIGAAPLRVENVTLSADNAKLEGKILVRNIAFHKQVSVRFTNDFWQTQSEARAEFKESIAGTDMDRFIFSVPLDMEKLVVEKTFCMAVRYQVNGGEFWDSNNGMNYHVECKRVVLQQAPKEMKKKINSVLFDSSSIGKPLLKKKMGGRYDLSTSLSAAVHSPVSAIKAASPIPVPQVMTPYRPSEYITPPSSTPGYHQQLYASSPKFIDPYMSANSPPDHFRLGFENLRFETPMSNSKHNKPSAWGGIEIEQPSPSSKPQMFTAGFYSSYSPKSSSPITIPSSPANQNGRPAVGSSSYYDLVDRYCFYESSPYSSPYSNSPPAPCIRG